MIKAGIIGGAGYTAGEMLRILLNHPQVEISFVHSKSNAGNPVASVHQDLLGETDLVFSADFHQTVDVLFLCLGHGQSKVFLDENPFMKAVKIIDLSQDYRLGESDFVYGLPELNKSTIQQADKIANPGCFATAIQLALLPLASKHLLRQDVHINAVTGSTGAGQSLSATSHFSWRNNNVSVYKIFTHQHLKEIRQSLLQLQEAFAQELYFIPVRGNFTRGILATAYTRSDLNLEEANALYHEFYQDHPFTIISYENPALKQVVNTNKCILHLEKHENMLLVVSIIDNLVKGASGQAVQNMNLMFGLEETEGLRMKPVGF
ncbi:MAG: N-acetyl-gamma-glutamyl-phosphate reductase [Cyclobacteriaceae bacterium]